MKDMIRLTSGELLYLSAYCGVDYIWPVPDVFVNMAEADLRVEIASVQQSLQEKGYTEVLFDGGFSPQERVLAYIRDCARWEHFLQLETSELEQSGRELRFFAGAHRLIRYEQIGADQLLSTVSPENVWEELCAAFAVAQDEDRRPEPEPLVTAAALLRRLGSLSRRRFLEELAAVGCDPQLASMVAEGLQGETEYQSLEFFERQDKTTPCYKLVTLRPSGGTLLVTPEEAEGKESLRFAVLKSEMMQNELRKAVTWFSHGEEAEH